MNYRIFTIALGLLPLALSVGCEKKQSKEEIIAEYEASKAAEERVAKLEQELEEFKAEAAENAQAQQLKEEQQKALEKQIQEAQKKAEEARQLAKAVEAGKAQPAAAPQQPAAAPGGTANDGSNRGNRPDRGERQERRIAKNIVVPKGTKLVVALSEELSTETSKAADSWAGSLASDVTIANEVVWKAGSPVSGVVSQSTPAGRLANGEGALAIRLTAINGVDIDGGIYVVQGNAKGARNAKVIGTTTALGALVGILSDKKNQTDHALGGAAIGAAVGTAVAAGTASTVIKMPVATPVEFAVPNDATVTLRNQPARQ